MKTSNEAITLYLERLAAKDEPLQTLLFAGPKSTEKETVARQFAASLLQATLLESHPDFYLLQPEGKIGMHSMDSVRRCLEEAFLPPFQAKKKVFLILEAERMLPYSANALLKTMEEPLPHCALILVSTHPEKLLPTIFSRCHLLTFRGGNERPDPNEEHPLLTQFLMSRKTIGYPQVARLVKELAKTGEGDGPVEDEEVELTPYQTELKEKRQEGAATLKTHAALEKLFVQILGWFRDMHLLQYGAPHQELFYPQHLNALQTSCQRGEFVLLEFVLKAVEEAKVSLERSTPIEFVLENLLLKFT